MLLNIKRIVFYYKHFGTSVNHKLGFKIMETLLTPLNRVVLWK